MVFSVFSYLHTFAVIDLHSVQMSHRTSVSSHSSRKIARIILTERQTNRQHDLQPRNLSPFRRLAIIAKITEQSTLSHKRSLFGNSRLEIKRSTTYDYPRTKTSMYITYALIRIRTTAGPLNVHRFMKIFDFYSYRYACINYYVLHTYLLRGKTSNFP